MLVYDGIHIADPHFWFCAQADYVTMKFSWWSNVSLLMAFLFNAFSEAEFLPMAFHKLKDKHRLKHVQ